MPINLESLDITEISIVCKQDINNTINTSIDEMLDSSFDFDNIIKAYLKTMLKDYVSRGKLLRSAIFLYFLTSYNVKLNYKKFLPITAVIELLQAFLLIHDDVMDDDDTRRGNPSIHIQLQNILPSDNINNNIKDGGKALAICLGDIIYAHTFKILAEQTFISEVLTLITQYALLIRRVGIGQFYDVMWSYATLDNKALTPETILNMYEKKTGDYTFTLPTQLAFLCTQNFNTKENNKNIHTHKELALLQKLGNNLGVLFQIQDDIIGAKYDTSITGKPQGSDFINKKQTYIYSMLITKAQESKMKLEHSDMTILEHINIIFQKQCITNADVNTLLQIADSLNIWDIIDKKQKNCIHEINQIIDKLQISKNQIPLLNNFIEYLLQRKQ